MAAFDVITTEPGNPYYGWTPAERPTEILHDMLEKIETLRAHVPPPASTPLVGGVPPSSAATDPDAESTAPVVETAEALMERVGAALFDFVNAEAENMRALSGAMPCDAYLYQSAPFVGSLVALIDRIGPRATVPVLAQHLVNEGHRETPEPTAAEALALEVMAVTVRGLKAIAAAIAAEKAATPPPEPPPVPRDQTTLEPVSGFMDTFGRAAS